MSTTNVPSSITDRQKVKAALVECTHAFQRIEDEQESIKEMINDVAEKTGINKKLLRRVARTMYKHTYSDVIQENEEFETLYELLVKDKAKANDSV